MRVQQGNNQILVLQYAQTARLASILFQARPSAQPAMLASTRPQCLQHAQIVYQACTPVQALLFAQTATLASILLQDLQSAQTVMLASINQLQARLCA